MAEYTGLGVPYCTAYGSARGFTRKAGVHQQRRTHPSQATRHGGLLGGEGHFYGRPTHPKLPPSQTTRRLSPLARRDRGAPINPRNSYHGGLSPHGSKRPKRDLLGEYPRPTQRTPSTHLPSRPERPQIKRERILGSSASATPPGRLVPSLLRRFREALTGRRRCPYLRTQPRGLPRQPGLGSGRGKKGFSVGSRPRTQVTEGMRPFGLHNSDPHHPTALQRAPPQVRHRVRATAPPSSPTGRHRRSLDQRTHRLRREHHSRQPGRTTRPSRGSLLTTKSRDPRGHQGSLQGQQKTGVHTHWIWGKKNWIWGKKN